MRKVLFPLVGPLVLLAACSDGAQEYTADREAAEAPADRLEAESAVSVAETSPAPNASADIPVSTPQIAYIYDFGFRVTADAMSPLQQSHADLCTSKGDTVCRIISLEQSGSEGDYAYGSLQLAVAAGAARSFSTELATVSEQMDGQQISKSIQGEDLSKQIVDTEARLRARTLLRDRLMEILRSRRGTVAELVEAERGVAQVNEEIDQASSWLAEMKNRVAFSKMTINYSSGERSTGGFMGPIRQAFSSIGSVMGSVIAGIILLLTAAIPIILLVLGIRWIWRKSGMRLRKPSALTRDTTLEAQE
ncbi:DUF4349 domain-containing protein [Altererythrobacter sp. RZ02]|uniref:DUF4349 domain-containing protein n=1 Tax=Pontixanthobacter rizhaonensis TaxID=2730337 RepID=A0A848QL10_9SPHN|nr:DUF4349 domain-containing protein [Pontixanthobacter rizhaonensis]NMW30875.1 DUF4349 domain-containing protein [Pontixanthobacter rizhaonensis]